MCNTTITVAEVFAAVHVSLGNAKVVRLGCRVAVCVWQWQWQWQTRTAGKKSCAHIYATDKLLEKKWSANRCGLTQVQVLLSLVPGVEEMVQ